MKLNYIISLSAILFLVSTAFSQSEKELLKDEDGIKIYSQRNKTGDRITITGITKVRGDIEAAAALMHDAGNYTNWFHAAVVSEKKKVYRANDFIYYLKSDLPWPADDRDAYIRMTINADKKNGVLHVETRSKEKFAEPKEDITRIKNMEGRWVFKKEGRRRLSVVYEVESPVPDYLPEAVTDQIYQTGPFETLKNLQQMLRKRKYRKADPGWL